MKRIALVGLSLSAYLAAHTASAALLVNHTAGLKLLAGADVWSTPSNIPFGYSGPGFAGNGGGVGYGAMPYYELRLIKFVGVEAGINYEHGSFHRNVSVNAVDFRETITLNSWRLPILAKLNIPMGVGRFWLGVGPEFTLAQSSSGKVERVSDGSSAGSISTRDVKPTYVTGGLGLVIELPFIGIEIPIELRASNNLSQPDNYADRVALSSSALYSVRAESSWVYRLGAGLGIQF